MITTVIYDRNGLIDECTAHSRRQDALEYLLGWHSRDTGELLGGGCFEAFTHDRQWITEGLRRDVRSSCADERRAWREQLAHERIEASALRQEQAA